MAGGLGAGRGCEGGSGAPCSPCCVGVTLSPPNWIQHRSEGRALTVVSGLGALVPSPQEGVQCVGGQREGQGLVG